MVSTARCFISKKWYEWWCHGTKPIFPITRPFVWGIHRHLQGLFHWYRDNNSLSPCNAYTVRCRYNVVSFLVDHHRRHTIARLRGRAMGWLLCTFRPWFIFCPIVAVLYAVSCYIGPRYTGTWLYVHQWSISSTLIQTMACRLNSVNQAFIGTNALPWETTFLERPQNLVVTLYRFHCITKWKQSKTWRCLYSISYTAEGIGELELCSLISPLTKFLILWK